MATTTTSDTGQAALLVIKEADWGVTPALVGTGANKLVAEALRFTSEDLKIDTTTTVSEEIRDDRQYSDIIPTKIEASGSINTEMSYGSYDDFMAAAICEDWADGTEFDADSSPTTSVKATVAVGTTKGTVTTAATATIAADAQFKVGQAITFTGFTGAAASNNGKIVVIVKKVVTAGTGIVYDVVPTLPAAADAITGLNARAVNNGTIANGLLDTSFSIEKQFNDVTKHLIYRGMSINTASFTVEAESIVSTNWTFIGKNGETLGDSDNVLEGTGNTAHKEATTNEIISAGTQDCLLIIDGKEEGFVKSVSSEINNNLRGKTVVCVVGNAEIGQGRFMFTGSLSMYFEDFTIYQKYIDNETASLVFTIGNTSTGLYVFNLPRIKFTESNIVAGGADQDVMVDGSFQALLDPDSGKTLTVTKIG